MTRSEMAVRPGSDPEAGFTLVEVLVAMSLLSLLGMVLFGSLRIGLGAWDRGVAHADKGDRSVVVQQLLRRVISDAYPYYVVDNVNQPWIDFEGTAKSIRFLATAPAVLGGAGRSRFEIDAEGHEGDVSLVIRSQPELSSRDDGSNVIAKRLLSGARNIEFSYFGHALSDRHPRWHDSWSRQIALPRLIRVRVRYPDDGDRYWPEFVIAPRIAVDVGCIFDPLTKDCRGR